MIFNVMDLISGVSQVVMCYGRNLILSKLKSSSFNIPLEARTNTWSDFQYSSKKPMKILKNALNLSHGNVTCLVFHFYEFIKNELLICAAERYNVHSLI